MGEVEKWTRTRSDKCEGARSLSTREIITWDVCTRYHGLWSLFLGHFGIVMAQIYSHVRSMDPW